MNWPTMTYDIVQAGRDLGISHNSSSGNGANPAPKPKVYDAPQERPGYKAPIDRVAKRESVMEYLERQARESRALQEATVANDSLKSTEEVLEECWIAYAGNGECPTELLAKLPGSVQCLLSTNKPGASMGCPRYWNWSRNLFVTIAAYRIIA